MWVCGCGVGRVGSMLYVLRIGELRMNDEDDILNHPWAEQTTRTDMSLRPGFVLKLKNKNKNKNKNIYPSVQKYRPSARTKLIFSDIFLIFFFFEKHQSVHDPWAVN